MTNQELFDSLPDGGQFRAGGQTWTKQNVKVGLMATTLVVRDADKSVWRPDQVFATRAESGNEAAGGIIKIEPPPAPTVVLVLQEEREDDTLYVYLVGAFSGDNAGARAAACHGLLPGKRRLKTIEASGDFIEDFVPLAEVQVPEAEEPGELDLSSVRADLNTVRALNEAIRDKAAEVDQYLESLETGLGDLEEES